MVAAFHSIILAGGISNRMGFPKALVVFGNSYFLHRIYETLVAGEAVPVHIVINTGLYGSLKSRLKEFPQGKFIQNSEPGRGQIYSLQLGLHSAQDAGADAAIVALVDQPAISVSTVAALCQKHEKSPGKIYIASFEGKPGHPILIPKNLFAPFLNAGEHQTARDVIANHSSLVEYVETNDPQVIADIDSPADLARLRELENEIDT